MKHFVYKGGMSYVMSGTQELRLEIVQDEQGFDAIEGEWRGIFESSPSATTPLKWEWMREWWRIFGDVYGSTPGGLHLITVRAGAELKAVLPLYIKAQSRMASRTLRFVSTGESRSEVTYPEYMDLLCDPAYAQSYTELISRYVFGTLGRSWDEFNLGILAPGSSLHTLTQKSYPPIKVWSRELQHNSWQANLGASFEGYLSSLSSSTRQNFRRLLKQVESAGFEFSVASGTQQIDKFLSELMQLHQERWIREDMPGAFGTARIKQFHQALTQQLVPKNEALLSRVSINNVPIALIYGFINKRKFDFYQSGVNAAHKELKSPGILAHLLTMQYLSAHQVQTYDFLVGNDLYKERLATSSVNIAEICLVRPTVRSALSFTRTTCTRIAGKLRRYAGSHSK